MSDAAFVRLQENSRLPESIRFWTVGNAHRMRRVARTPGFRKGAKDIRAVLPILDPERGTPLSQAYTRASGDVPKWVNCPPGSITCTNNNADGLIPTVTKDEFFSHWLARIYKRRRASRETMQRGGSRAPKWSQPFCGGWLLTIGERLRE